MGCDIHMVVEKLCWNYDDATGGRDKLTWKMICSTEGSYGGRNYDLFSVLADVRNASDGPTRIPPISTARGLPVGISKEARAELESADHSFSWLTIKEVLDYDWDAKKLVENGTVNALNAALAFSGHLPRRWNGGIGGPSIRNVSPSEMHELLRAAKLRPEDALVLMDQIEEQGLKYFLADRQEDALIAKQWPSLVNVYTTAFWKLDLRKRCGYFLSWIETMSEACNWYLDQGKNAEEIRLVFGFDS